MEDLTPNEVARLHLKARHGTLTPEEQQVYSDYMARQIASAQPPEAASRRSTVSRSAMSIFRTCLARLRASR